MAQNGMHVFVRAYECRYCLSPASSVKAWILVLILVCGSANLAEIISDIVINVNMSKH